MPGAPSLDPSSRGESSIVLTSVLTKKVVGTSAVVCGAAFGTAVVIAWARSEAPSSPSPGLDAPWVAAVVAGVIAALVLVAGIVHWVARSVYPPHRLRRRLGLTVLACLLEIAAFYALGTLKMMHDGPMFETAVAITVIAAVASIYLGIAWLSILLRDSRGEPAQPLSSAELQLADALGSVGRVVESLGETAAGLAGCLFGLLLALGGLVLVVWLVKTIWYAV